MQFAFTRTFDFPLARGVILTVKYTGNLVGYRDGDTTEYITEIDSIDAMAVAGKTYTLLDLDPQVEDILIDRAYEHADSNLDSIWDDLEIAMSGAQ